MAHNDDNSVDDLTKSMGKMSTNFTIQNVKNLIKKYGLSCNAERIYHNYGGDEENIINVLKQQHTDKVLASNRNANAFLKSSRSGISKGGKKSRRNTRRRKYSKKQKPSRKQTRRHRHRR